MSNISAIALGLMIPFVGTSLGSAMVFFLRGEINKKIQKLLLGFASGVMICISILDLILLYISINSLLYLLSKSLNNLLTLINTSVLLTSSLSYSK